MDDLFYHVKMVVVIVITAMISSLFWAVPVMVIWNLSFVMGLTMAVISYWQAYCLVMFLKFLRSLI